MLLIAERVGTCRWDCRAEERPEVSASAPLPLEAMRRLCGILGLPASCYVAVERTTNRIVFRKGVSEPTGPCPDCGGSGRYVGLIVVEPCRTCRGSGSI